MSRRYYHQPNPYPPLGPDIPANVVLICVGAGFLLLYYILHGLGAVPSVFAIMLGVVNTIFGVAAKERVASMFAQASPTYMASRVRQRAASMVGVDSGEGFVAGLWNLGNTCYQNSVLQALASLPGIGPHLNVLEMEDEMENGVATELNYLVKFLNALSHKPRAESPPALLTKFESNGWMYNEQQDAQEYLQGLMSSLEKEAEEALKRRKSQRVVGLEGILSLPTPPNTNSQTSEADNELRSPFEGLYAQRVGCLRCGYVESISLQPFTTLSLPIPDQHHTFLEECIHKFTEIEQIHNVDCDKCSLLSYRDRLESQLKREGLSAEFHEILAARFKAVEDALTDDNFTPNIEGVKYTGSFKVSTTKTKQVMLCRTPQVLILHMNRSQYDPYTGNIIKNHASVKFPKLLDLQQLNAVTDHQHLTTDPSRPMSFTREGGGRVVYELRAAVCHQGAHNNGHYTTFRKFDGRWWNISDHSVQECSESMVLDAPHGFMLFYERLEAAAIPADLSSSPTGLSPSPAILSPSLSEGSEGSGGTEDPELLTLSCQQSEDGVLVTPPATSEDEDKQLMSPPDTPKQLLPTPPESEVDELEMPLAEQMVTPPPDDWANEESVAQATGNVKGRGGKGKRRKKRNGRK